MTITVRRVRAPIGRMDRVQQVLRGDGWTLGAAVAAIRDPQWPDDVALEALVNGEVLSVHDHADRELVDGDDVTVAPSFQGLDPISLFAIQLFIFAASYALQKIAQPDLVDRTSDESPTYNFRGIGTQRGPGAPIAIGYGRLRVGQQFIASRTMRDPSSRWTDSETILVQVALGIGPWHSVGNLALGLCGEANFLGGRNAGFKPLPAGLRINDTAIQIDDKNVMAHVRLGTLGQSPMPHGLDDVSTVYGLTAYQLVRGEPRIYTTASDEVDRLVLEWFFPQGLYRSSGGGQLVYVVEFDVRFRKFGENGWGPTTRVVVDHGEPAPGSFSWTQTYDLPELAQWEFEVNRITADDQAATGGNITVSTSELESVTEQRLTRLAYPNVALLGLEVQGNERVDGDLVAATVPCSMRLVRRWTGSAWTEPEWADGTGKVTSMNPAWIMVDMLTMAHYGGGALGYTLDDIDTAAFAAFAAYCDEQVPIADSLTERRHECSIYFDTDEHESLDAALAVVAATARAAYIREGKRHTVVWDAPKDRSLLLTSERVNNVSLRYRNPSGRPTSYVMQILDEAQDWDLVEVPVEDADAAIDVTSLDRDQLWQERVNLKGVTRRTAAVREATYRHRANFYRDLEVSFDVTRWAVPLQVLDRFALALDMPRWYSSVDTDSGSVTFREVLDDGTPYIARIVDAGTDTTQVFIDRELSLSAGTWVCAIQSTDGSGNDTVEIRTIAGTSSPLLIVPSRPILLTAAASFGRDSQIVIGRADRVVVDFIVTEKRYDPQTLKQTIVAEKYDELVYDVVAEEAPSGTGDAVAEVADAALSQQVSRAAPQVGDVTTALMPDADRLQVRWTRPGAGRGHRFRVYTRQAGKPWTMQGETSGTSLEVPPVPLGSTADVSVTARPEGGTWPGPESGVQVVVVGQEFSETPPPDVVSVRAKACSTGICIDWDDVASPQLDYYELRRGPQWYGAQLVARTRDPQAMVRDARVYARIDATRGETYWLRARHRNGLYSSRVVGGQLSTNPPDGMTLDVAGSQLDITLGTATGTLESCYVDSSTSPPRIRMNPDAFEALYTLPLNDAGSSAQRWISLAAGAVVQDTTSIDDLGGIVAGEMHAWTIEGRDASPQRLGLDPAVVIESVLDIDDPAYTSTGRVGVTGHSVLIETELRLYDFGSVTWGPWRPWTADILTSRQVQGRVRMRRQSLAIAVALDYVQLWRTT